MKILCISDAWLPQVNGVVRTYQNLGHELAKMGHEFSVIGPASFSWTIPTPTYPEIRLALFARWSLPRRIREANADAVHIATEGPLGRAALGYCRKHKIPFTTCYHTRFPEYLAQRISWNWLSRTTERAAVKSLRRFHGRGNGIMVATAGLEAHLRGHGFTGPFHRLSRGVHSDLFRPGPATEFQNIKRPVALYVGRVSVEKNIEAFLDAPWPGSKVVVGHGPALDSLRLRYPDVTFTGLKEGEELAAHYRSADVFAFPSRTDTFGVVLLEALASGLPVAAFPAMGPQDIVTQPLLGCLNDDFAAALSGALKAPGSAQERAAYTQAHYAWPHVSRQFLGNLAVK